MHQRIRNELNKNKKFSTYNEIRPKNYEDDNEKITLTVLWTTQPCGIWKNTKRSMPGCLTTRISENKNEQIPWKQKLRTALHGGKAYRRNTVLKCVEIYNTYMYHRHHPVQIHFAWKLKDVYKRQLITSL